MVYVPFISTPSSQRRKLFRRKGGGGGGRGGGGGGRSGGGGGSSGGGRSVGGISSGGVTRGASTRGSGVRTVSTIPAGAPYAGRTEGGGTRSDVYGSRAYGSGYPGVVGKGTAGRGFPFFFWPVAFGGAGTGAYLYHNDYGHPRNGSRPGGEQRTATFTSSNPATTFYLLSDTSTVNSLVESIKEECGSSLSTQDIPTAPYDGADVNNPKPEQVVQYYRASSVALALDGYNNSATFTEDESAPDSDLPTNIDTNLLSCMNETIGLEVPLVDGAFSSFALQSNLGIASAIGLVWALCGVF